MNAWETIIQQVRNGDYQGAAQSYSYALSIPLAEARAVIDEAVKKVRAKIVERKETRHENISDQTD